jgi:hypothetical protein
LLQHYFNSIFFAFFVIFTEEVLRTPQSAIKVPAAKALKQTDKQALDRGKIDRALFEGNGFQ